MPAVVLGTHSAAVIMRQGRSTLIEVLEQDYVTAARAKGLQERLVVSRHALKNAMIPVVTVLGLQVGSLVVGDSRLGTLRLLRSLHAVLDGDARARVGGRLSSSASAGVLAARSLRPGTRGGRRCSPL